MTLLKLTNQVMDYAWGSQLLMDQVLGIPATGKPMAEIWFGTHPKSSAQVEDAQGKTLSQRIKRDVSFMVKFLAADKPLSIQVHPDKARASKQFALGNPSYVDANHKPEVLVAISEFRALCGFRPYQETFADLTKLVERDANLQGLFLAFQRGRYQEAIRWAFGCDRETVGSLVAATAAISRSQHKMLSELYTLYQGDPGVVIAFFMNRISLSPGEAIFVPAGTIHAYLSGLGVEVMAVSDNVLRGGLTEKPVDILELLEVLNYSPTDDAMVKPKKIANGLHEFELPIIDYKLYKAEPSSRRLLADLDLYGQDCIAVCVDGEVTISTSSDEVLTLKKGEAAYVGYSRLFSISGNGTAYLALG
ncbi:MAG: mannose-6-phosphate isomerase, class [Actinomycetota bacterium]|jgi:mannose-6-phosphate isomerase